MTFSQYPLCECKHHTCGNNCEYCCPLYNQKPWMEATLSGSSVCEQCQCHGHATACQYDAHVAANNRSINIRGEYIGGGVCINCTVNYRLMYSHIYFLCFFILHFHYGVSIDSRLTAYRFCVRFSDDSSKSLAKYVSSFTFQCLLPLFLRH